MSNFFKKIFGHSIDEKFYAAALREIRENRVIEGTFARALADSDGSEQSTRSKYVTYRALALKEEAELILAQNQKKLHWTKN